MHFYKQLHAIIRKENGGKKNKIRVLWMHIVCKYINKETGKIIN